MEIQVNPHFHVPANAIAATAVFVCVVSLINVGSTVAFNAVLSLASTAMMGTYLISIGMSCFQTAHCEQNADQY
jgi:amino acid transporter